MTNFTTGIGKITYTVDWRSDLSPIKNQGKCGGCYAFASSGALEGAYAIKTGEKTEIAP